MENKYGEFTGVSDIYYAIVTKDDASEYVAGEPMLLAPAGSIISTPTLNSKTTYYSNNPANNYVSEGATEVKMIVPNLPADIMAVALGKYFDAEKGVVYDDGQPNPPHIALGFKCDIGQGNARYYWYLKGTCQGGAEEAETRGEGGINEKTYELTYKALSTTHKFTVDGKQKPLKRIYADDTDENFAGAGTWFDAVQTPETINTPAQEE